MKSSDKLRQNIRDIREDKKMTQADIAEKLGLSETGYAKIERGESKADIDRLQKIADVLGVTLAEIIPFGDENVFVFNDARDNSNNSFSLGNIALSAEIEHLKTLLEAKNEIINSREREIESLKQQIHILEKLVETLDKK